MNKKLKLVVAVIIVAMLTTVMLAGCVVNKNSTAGMFPETDLARGALVTDKGGKSVKALVDGSNATTWKLPKRNLGYAEVDFGRLINFNTIVLREKTDAVEKFQIFAFANDAWTMIYEQDRIMKIRNCYVEPTSASKIRLVIAENNAKVSISSLEVYNQAKRDKNFKVTDYCTFDYNQETKTNVITDLKDDPGFTGYFNVITDLIIFNSVTLDKNCEIAFSNGEANFAESLNSMRYIIKNSDRDVKIWCTILFSVAIAGDANWHKSTADAFNNNRDKINSNIKTFVEKYNLYGVDYDWEYPQTASQWKTYDNLVIDTAKFTKVSVAIPPWGIKFSQKAIDVLEHSNVMGYDLFDKRGDHSNMMIAGVQAVNNVINAGFKREQIMLGIPTYGRTANGSENAWPTYGGSPELGKWGNIVRDYRYNELLKDETIMPSICDGYVNGFAMTRDKTLTAVNMNVGGVMVFRAKCDAPYTYEYSLHRAIKEVIDSRIGKN